MTVTASEAQASSPQTTAHSFSSFAPSFGLQVTAESRLCCIERSLDQISPEFIDSWKQLDTRAVDRIGVPSPERLIPTLRRLMLGRQFTVLSVHVAHIETYLAGIAVFERLARLPGFPLRTLSCVRVDLSGRNVLLFDGTFLDHAADLMIKQLKSRRPAIHGVSFRELRSDCRADEAIRKAARENGLKWHEGVIRAEHRGAGNAEGRRTVGAHSGLFTIGPAAWVCRKLCPSFL